jgi:hypothetical protein
MFSRQAVKLHLISGDFKVFRLFDGLSIVTELLNLRGMFGFPSASLDMLSLGIFPDVFL